MLQYFRARSEKEEYVVVRDGVAWCVLNRVDKQENTTGSPEPFEEFCARFKLGPLEPVELAPGEYRPRIWRGGLWPRPDETGHGREALESLRVGRMLASRLQEVFRYLEPVTRHRDVYSHELRMLFVLACMEVESACKEVLIANGTTRAKLTMGDYRKLAGPMRLDQWMVGLSTSGEYPPVSPFSGWGAGGASLSWFQAHHEVKHGRELHLDNATLGNTIEAVAAVFVMRLAQFGLPALVDRSAPLPADEFRVIRAPEWSAAERYLPPTTRGVDGGVGAAPMVAKPHPGLA